MQRHAPCAQLSHLLDVVDLMLAVFDRAPLVLALAVLVLAVFNLAPLVLAVVDFGLAVYDPALCQFGPISAFSTAI